MNTKQTEIGEIPKDWEVVKLERLQKLTLKIYHPIRRQTTNLIIFLWKWWITGRC